MGIFDDTLSKAKEAFDAVEKKTSEVVSVQKLKVNAASVSSQISKDYEALGRIYYNSIGQEDKLDPEVEAVVMEIRTKKEKLNDIRTEINKAKGGTVCDECGFTSIPGSAFCSKCGNKL